MQVPGVVFACASHPVMKETTMSETAQLLLGQVRSHVRTDLRPLVEQIDRQGFYPETWLRELGALGGFASLAQPEQGGSGLGLATQIEVMAAVGAECGATAFTLWCQGTFAWYLRQSSNAAVRERYLPQVLRGELLAGTGMSNTVKHLSGIEKHLLQAEPEEGGYVVSGSLPWVSNLGDEHVFAATAQLGEGGYVMFVVRGNAPGVTLKPCPEFCALEGTRTLNVRFDKVHIPFADVLAQPNEFNAFLGRVKPGFILLQIGMALGVIEGSLKLIRESNLTQCVTNAWLDDQHDDLQEELDALRVKTRQLAQQAEAGSVEMLPVLQARLHASELSLRAAQSAALHAGARGYLMRHAAQRRSREALFVAIVTPALKQLRHDIAVLTAANPAAVASQAAAAVTEAAGKERAGESPNAVAPQAAETETQAA